MLAAAAFSMLAACWHMALLYNTVHVPPHTWCQHHQPASHLASWHAATECPAAAAAAPRLTRRCRSPVPFPSLRAPSSALSTWCQARSRSASAASREWRSNCTLARSTCSHWFHKTRCSSSKTMGLCSCLGHACGAGFLDHTDSNTALGHPCCSHQCTVMAVAAL